MTIHQLVLLFIALTSAMLLAEPLARLLRLPQASIMVLLGYIGSELLIAAGGDTGLRAHSFHDLIFDLFVPLLVFEAAFRIDQRRLLGSLGLIMPLAILGMLLTTLIAAFLLFAGIGHPGGFPWSAALLTGAILAATDPIAVIERMRRAGAPRQVQILLEGESLFNDAVAIVLFGLFLELALMPAQDVSAYAAISRFLLVFAGGITVGAACGLLTGSLMNAIRDDALRCVMSLLTAFASYHGAEQLGASGVMASLLAGLVASGRLRVRLNTDSFIRLDELWDTLGKLANGLVFLMMGAVIGLEMFEQRWLAMLIGIAAILLARMLALYLLLPLFAPFSGHTSRAEKLLLGWGGLRGAITLALALSLPTELEYWWTIQSIAFGVVTFSLFLQAPSIGPAVRQLKLDNERGTG